MADQDAFVAAPSFEGPRSGCVFTTGERGTGYYRDSGTASASPAAARSGGDDAELQAELQGLGLSGQAEPIAEPVTEAEASAAVEKPPALAKRAEAAFEAASKLTRGGGGGAPPPPSSSEPLPEGGGGGVTGGGGSAGYDHLHPGALAKYRESLALYTEALQHSPVELCDPDLSSAERSKYLSCRAEVRIRLEQFGAAVHDCDVAIALASSDAAKAATEKRKRRAASMAVKIARRAEDTASKTMVSAAETIKQNKDLAKELAELDPETAKGGLKSMTLMAAVTKLKNRGNEAFKAKRWGAAAEDYRAGIVVIDLAQQEARREREAQRAAHLELDGDDYVSEIVESVEVSEAWPGEALNLRNLHGNLAAALLGLVRNADSDTSGQTHA
jgi:hypothetical protein